MGLWDQQPFLNMIQSHAFAFFITQGDEGDEFYNGGYTHAVAEAIRTAYPNEAHLAGHTIHLEASAPPL